jgi:hypothetical protein
VTCAHDAPRLHASHEATRLRRLLRAGVWGVVGGRVVEHRLRELVCAVEALGDAKVADLARRGGSFGARGAGEDPPLSGGRECV